MNRAGRNPSPISHIDQLKEELKPESTDVSCKSKSYLRIILSVTPCLSAFGSEIGRLDKMHSKKCTTITMAKRQRNPRVIRLMETESCILLLVNLKAVHFAVA